MGEAEALTGTLASMMVTRKWLARSRPAASPEKLPPITSTRRLDLRAGELLKQNAHHISEQAPQALALGKGLCRWHCSAAESGK